ncbi:hypothetical protein FACS189452_04300 [Bacteroidia bacterium]|nr:hypothetical protein FACS189452_04300 [Bacteroidia bacterium]
MMTHTMEIDDTIVATERFVKKPSTRSGVVFAKPVVAGIVPDGYVTVEEFRNEVKKRIRKYALENGIS